MASVFNRDGAWVVKWKDGANRWREATGLAGLKRTVEAGGGARQPVPRYRSRSPRIRHGRTAPAVRAASGQRSLTVCTRRTPCRVHIRYSRTPASREDARPLAGDPESQD